MINQKILSMVEAKGMSTILWDVDSNDWRLSKELPGKALKNIEDGIVSHHGSIVLQHDIFQYTIDGQPDIIRMIKNMWGRTLSQWTDAYMN